MVSAGPPQRPGHYLLSLRATLIMALALESGMVVGLLTFLSTRSPASAALAVLPTVGGTVSALHGLVERPPT